MTTPAVTRLAERVHGVPSYRPGRPSRGSTTGEGKLSANESPFGPAPSMVAAVERTARVAQRYPSSTEVTGLLAASLGVAAERVLLTSGSDELCYLLGTLALGAGTRAVVGDPCYQIDATATVIGGGTLVRVPLVEGAHDLDAMAAASRQASLVWLPSPHNPTGVAVEPGALEDFLRSVPTTCLVVLDEAYRGFVRPELRPDVSRLLAEHEHLIVQRTFSKDWALAGLRAGYAIAAASLVSSLERVRPPFSLNAAALSAIAAGLLPDAQAWREMTVAHVTEGRGRLTRELEHLGIEYFPSEANFVTARIAYDCIRPLLDAVGLSFRSGDDLGLPGWTRISIGWAPQMALARQVLRRYARERAARAGQTEHRRETSDAYDD